MDQSKTTKQKPTFESLLYFIKNTGKAIVELVQDSTPRFKQFNEEIKNIASEANKIHDKTSKQEQPVQSIKSEFKVLS